MKTRKAIAEWKGDLKSGKGSFSTDSGSLVDVPYTFNTRFGQDKGADPEEFLAAALAGCFSMEMSARLTADGFKVNRIDTSCSVEMNSTDKGKEITRFELDCEGDVEGISEDKFKHYAQDAGKNCIVARTLSAVKITHSAKLAQKVS
jgi:lipoyl-dependent peroxiredoxin